MEKFIKVVGNDNQEKYYMPKGEAKLQEVYASLLADKVKNKIKEVDIIMPKEGAAAAQVVYWEGNLAADCKKCPGVVAEGKREPKTKREQEGLQANLMRAKYFAMYEQGRGFLTQKAVGDGTFKYIFTPCK